MKRTIRFASLAALALLVAVLGACAAGQPVAPTATAPAAPTQNGPGYIRLSPQQLKQMLAGKDFLLVNVHIPYDGEIAQTDLFIPYDQIAGQLDKLPDKNVRIVVYCRSGPMSTAAAQTLVAAGYTDVMELAGGMSAWESAGYALIRK